MSPTPILASQLPHPAMPYSQAVRAGDLLFISGQTGTNFTTGILPDDFEGQARQDFENVSIILKAADQTMQSITKTTIWLVMQQTLGNSTSFIPSIFPKTLQHVLHRTVVITSFNCRRVSCGRKW